MSSSVPTLGYWDIRGLGEAIRYLLKYAGVEYNDKRYDIQNRDTWLSVKPTLGLDFPNLPYYIDGDIKLTQSLTILRYLAHKHGLAARDEPTRALQEVVEQQIQDMRIRFLFSILLVDGEPKKEAYCTGTLEPQLDLLVKFMGEKQWLTGQLSYVDFLAYETLDWFRLFSLETIGKYPAIIQYLDHFEELPAIKTYRSSTQYKSWPIFGRPAKWGAQ